MPFSFNRILNLSSYINSKRNNATAQTDNRSAANTPANDITQIYFSNLVTWSVGASYSWNLRDSQVVWVHVRIEFSDTGGFNPIEGSAARSAWYHDKTPSPKTETESFGKVNFSIPSWPANRVSKIWPSFQILRVGRYAYETNNIIPALGPYIRM